jgi:hypothetical protein
VNSVRGAQALFANGPLHGFLRARVAPLGPAALALLCLVGSLPWLIGTVVGEAVRRNWTGRDFDDLWVAARMTLRGHAAEVFDIASFQAAFKAMLGVGSTVQIYSYPPHALFLAVPVGAMPYPAALILWDGATLAFFLWAARPFIAQGVPWWVAALSPASLICLGFGQYGLLTSALFLLAFRGSGLSAALLTIKPHIGFLVAVRMLRDRRALLMAVTATIALIGASALVFGREAWVQFLTESVPYQLSRVASADATVRGMQVTPAFTYGFAGQVVFAAAAIFFLTRCFNLFTAATATFLIAPYGFHYDMPAACLGFAYLLATRDLPLAEKALLAIAFCVPGLVGGMEWVASPFLLLGLYVQTREWRERELVTCATQSIRRLGDRALAAAESRR